MLLINNFVYCCAGLNGYEILKTCERYDISKSRLEAQWDNNLPTLKCPKFSMTMLLMDKYWIYSFGGATEESMTVQDSKGLEIERLNTALVDSLQLNRNHEWERIVVKTKRNRCCQQGVIPLNTSWGDEHIGQIGERRYLIFGGVFNDFIDTCFILNENLTDLGKSYCSEALTKRLPFKDKFFYQQTFKITDLPEEIVKQVAESKTLTLKQKQFSENMIVYTGRKGLHIYDIDRENWIFNSPD